MTIKKLCEALLALVPADGSTIGNVRLRQALAEKLGHDIDDTTYEAARDALVADGVLAKGQGRGGSVRLAILDGKDQPDEQPPPLVLQNPEPKASSPKKTPPKKGAKPTTPRVSSIEDTQVLSYRHPHRRKNNPEVGLVDPDTDPQQPKTKWAYDPHLDPSLQFDIGRSQVEKLIDDALASGDQETMRRALAQLKRQAEPYLNWTGKAERTSFEVDTVSLHVHERIDPASILNAVRKHLKGEKAVQPRMQLGLFAAPFENLPLRDAIDFYKHDKGWSNRLIAGDSLLVMNSLLQKESMAGQVQMIYIDPPYGVKYGSNFQPFTNSKPISRTDRDEDLTQEPETIKAFRDTWELGIHSYLTYLRDRLLLAHRLLHPTGSIFVQISDENHASIRALLAEIFGESNLVVSIPVKKKGSQKGAVLDPVNDYLVWAAKDRSVIKCNKLFLQRESDEDITDDFSNILLSNGLTTTLAKLERDNGRKAGDYRKNLALLRAEYPNARLFKADPSTGGNPGRSQAIPYRYRGSDYDPGVARGLGWKAAAARPTGGKESLSGMDRLAVTGRLHIGDKQLAVRRFPDDFGLKGLSNWWDGLGGAADPIYVVQTNERIVERCILLTTDAGDLVLDPTCGSGTTAFVAEKWGRRWITCDTSRVAVTLAKQRLMTAGFDYYELKYPHEGLKGGFIYKTVPHIMAAGIANNPEIDEIYNRLHPAVLQALDQLNIELRKSPPGPFTITEGGRKGKTVDFKAAPTKTVELPTGEKVPAGALLEWEVPFDFPEEWPASARAAFDAFREARQRMQRQMDMSIGAHADPEVLYDQPQVARDKLRISGPFSVEAVPFPTVLALDDVRTPEEADVSIARSGESSRQHQWRDELLKTGIRSKGGQMMKFAALEPLPDTPHLHVSGTLADTGQRVVVSFGPEHGAIEQRQVEMAMREAGTLFPRPTMLIFAAFAFDPEAAKDIDQTKGIVALKAQMNTDLLTEDLKKARSSNQSFWLMGQPDIEVRKRNDGLYEVEVNGFDYFDTTKGELISGGKGKIAVWLLDTDYDERSLFPRQVFFPMAGAKDGWNKLRKDIRAELDESRLSEFHGTVSLPFEAGENKKVAVKVVDDRGIESLKVIRLD